LAVNKEVAAAGERGRADRLAAEEVAAEIDGAQIPHLSVATLRKIVASARPP